MTRMDRCSQDGAELIVIPTTTEMIKDSPGYEHLARSYVKLTHRPVPIDKVVCGMCPDCDATYFWIGDDYPRINVSPLDPQENAEE